MEYPYIQEIFDIVEQGVTMPVRAILSDGRKVIAKYPNNIIGNQILVNEFIGSSIAKAIDVNVPEYGVCIMSDDVIEQASLEYDGLSADNSGTCFYTEYISQSIPITNGIIMSMSIEDFDVAKLILFDHIICNQDRHKGNMILDTEKNRLYSIDHGTLFTKGPKYDLDSLAEYKNIDSLNDIGILKSNYDIYSILWTKFSCRDNDIYEACEKIKKELSMERLWQVKDSIPLTWFDLVGIDIINQIFEVIQFRINRLEAICKLIIEARRKL